MKSDHLINALVADLGSSTYRYRRNILLALLAGAALSATIFVGLVGPRGDLAAVYTSWRFLTKFVVTLSLALVAAGLSLRLSRPEAQLGKWVLALALVPTILFFACVAELFLVSPQSWWTRIIGVNPQYCVTLIPALAAAPLAGMLYALRQGASSEPELSGLLAGYVAGGLGGAIYATHCADDSPLFMATWYTLGVSIVALIGAKLGSRILNW